VLVFAAAWQGRCGESTCLWQGCGFTAAYVVYGIANHVHDTCPHAVFTLHFSNHPRVELAMEVAEADVAVGGKTRMVSGSRQDGELLL
jgi:hypothetical protein